MMHILLVYNRMIQKDFLRPPLCIGISLKINVVSYPSHPEGFKMAAKAGLRVVLGTGEFGRRKLENQALVRNKLR